MCESADACSERLVELNIAVGSASHPDETKQYEFAAADYEAKGCYTYEAGHDLHRHGFFGENGTRAQMTDENLAAGRIRVLCYAQPSAPAGNATETSSGVAQESKPGRDDGAVVYLVIVFGGIAVFAVCIVPMVGTFVRRCLRRRKLARSQLAQSQLEFVANVGGRAGPTLTGAAAGGVPPPPPAPPSAGVSPVPRRSTLVNIGAQFSGAFGTAFSPRRHAPPPPPSAHAASPPPAWASAVPPQPAGPGFAALPPPPPPSSVPLAQLPHGWEVLHDEAGDAYYHNTATGEVSWHKPV